MKKTALVLCITAIVLVACSKSKTENHQDAHTATSEITASQPVESTTSTATADHAETSLDWAGDYKGTLPCASCEGIKTELELNKDKTYELTQEYLGDKGGENKTTIKGSFTFDAKNPSIITLDKAGNNQKFFVGENFVTFRSAETGEAITGPMADLYKLSKEN